MVCVMRKYLVLGWLVGLGTIGVANGAIAQTPPPVVRASGFSKQVPACYIQTTSGDWQNLDAACLMGKVPESKMFDIVTDRDGDGVPDDLVPLFKQMNEAFKLSANTPEGRASQVKQIQKTFQTMAQRLPISAASRRGLNEMGQAMNALNDIQQLRPGVEPDPKLVKQMERLSELSRQFDQDPVLKKINGYANRYERNQRSVKR
jgi:hypothetical protein